jgi:hypothetical protein
MLKFLMQFLCHAIYLSLSYLQSLIMFGIMELHVLFNACVHADNIS